MQRPEEVDGLLVLGETYSVPCLPTPFGLAPIIPFPHRDPELNNPALHVHYDYRFFTDDLRRRMINHVGNSVVPVINVGTDIKYTYIDLKCTHPEDKIDPCQMHRKGVMYIKEIEQICHDKKMVGGICPHKGYSLKGVKPEPDGTIICPLHGSRWKADGSYAGNTTAAESLLAKYLSVHQTPSSTVTVRLYVNDIWPEANISLKDLLEAEHYVSYKIHNVVYQLHPRPSFYASGNCYIKFLRSIPFHGSYMTVDDWNYPIWMQRYGKGCKTDPLVLPKDDFFHIYFLKGPHE